MTSAAATIHSGAATDTRTATTPIADARTALVLSGGGAKGSYQIGVMKALFEGASPATGYRPLAVDLYTGASVGSYNAAFMASHDPAGSELEVARELEEIWRRRIAEQPSSCEGNGVYRLRASPATFVEPACWLKPLDGARRLTEDVGFLARLFAEEARNLVTSRTPFPSRLLERFDIAAFFDLTPFHQLLHDTIDLDGLRHSSRALIIMASDFAEGTPKPFFKRDLADGCGLLAIVGSAAIPGIFPPAIIDGVPYVDGGLTMNTPLGPALARGAKSLHVVFLDPLVRDFTPPKSAFGAIYRLMMIQMASSIHNNLTMLPNLVEKLRAIRKLRMEGKRDEMEDAMREMVRTFSPQNLEATGNWPFEDTEIHKYIPPTDLGGASGLLDFGLENIDRNIDQGYRDAIEHDCSAAGCILPRNILADRRAPPKSGKRRLR